MSLPEPLQPLAAAWRGVVRTPRRWATVAGVTLLIACALLLARGGTTRARVCAGSAIALVGIAFAIAGRRESRVWSDAHATIDRLAGDVDPLRAARAQRALGLLGDRRPLDGTSSELAALHVRRALDAIPAAEVQRGAARVAHRFANASLVLALGVLGLVIVAGWSVLEGLDVLVASHRIAPVAMKWLEGPTIDTRPPDYLHERERHYDLERDESTNDLALPRGTLLTVLGAPVRGGRRLVLTDGTSEVPFVDDGQGNVIARWPLAESVALRTVARFGDVVIPEGRSTRIFSIADEAPVVTLEDAPRRIELAREDVGEIEIRYEANDDHGLREVHLVLRAGPREERRVLARLDGETRTDKGGYVLHAGDPFIKKSHVPVDVRVEAKDNDPITGPKWGASPAITIVPPDVGEPQAMRIEALRVLRDRLVDSLAWRMEHTVPSKVGDRRPMLADEGKTVDDDAEMLDATLSGDYAGARIQGRLQALLRGQMRKVREALATEVRVASPQTHTTLVKASEKIVLVCDAIARGLGDRDAKGAAKQLADVADDAASEVGPTSGWTGGSSSDPGVNESERRKARVDADVDVLERGGKSMVRLGELGRDIGEIVATDLTRVARARGEGDAPHAELAARDLAARLREPDPSFGERGGRSSAGAGESGGSPGMEGDEGKGGEDDVERAFEEAAEELDKLAQDHANGMSKVENALAGGASADDVKSMLDESKKHADNVRDAAHGLPAVGAGSESWSGKAATAREQAEQMARSLEQGSAADAVSSGRSALQTLDEAERAARSDAWRRWNDQASDGEKVVDAAKKKLEPEIAWAEQKVSELRKKAAERAREQLGEQGQEENAMAERARRLGDKGHEQMPSGALDALEEAERTMQQAADDLRAGDPDKGMAQQKEAQRQLEMARQAMGSNEDGDGSQGHGSQNDDDSNDPSNGRADIPGANDHKGPEEFRRRVTEGLSQPSSGRLKDAVRRYAAGLLR